MNSVHPEDHAHTAGFALEDEPADVLQVARAIFNATFHPDDVINGNADAAWHQWPEDRNKAIRQARSALATMPPLINWRPIADADRDGRPLLLAWGTDTVAEGWWQDDDADPYPWKFIDTGCLGGAGPYRILINGSRDDKYGPTHFAEMPRRQGSPASKATAQVERDQSREAPQNPTKQGRVA